MEEILASIRRIIAEDGDAAAPAEKPAAEKPAKREEEVLELTEVVEEDGSVVSLSTGGAKKPAPEPPPKRAIEPAPPPPEPEPEPEPEQTDEDRLVSETTAAASMAALSQLSTLTAQRPQISDMPLGDANRTLLEVVRELLRPMLKDWLDANLPPLVERLVQEEIRRVSKEILSR
ncbi:MAG TPA: DUF2497 domain-containing protein [Stellaceae bacterium]|nr:DUF2497 domain-containing protein [Stellaceae bacterium]